MIKFMKKLPLFFLLILVSSPCYAQEVYDVELLPALRTKRYDAGNYKKIVVFSAPRTGSSLVYNICRFLFEDDSKLLAHHNDFSLNRLVLKSHKFSEIKLIKKEKAFYIFTLRNPLTASISNYRICMQKVINDKFLAKEIVQRHYKVLLFSEYIEKKGRSVLKLKYEDFANNLDFIFDTIESHFQISIDPTDKDLMRKSYSKENVYACTKDLKNFKESLPISGFHGQHVGLQEYTPPEVFLYWLQIYLQDTMPLFQRHGYNLNAI